MNRKPFFRPVAIAGICALSLVALATTGPGRDAIEAVTRSLAERRAEAARELLVSGLVDLEHAFETIGQAIDPSVVAVATSRVVTGRDDEPPATVEEFLRRHLEGRIPPQSRTERGLGSGVVVNTNGHIVTNNHVVERADDLVVFLSDGRRLKATVVGTDPRTDLAVIKVEATDLVPARFGNSDEVKVGQWVAAFGSPFGLQRSMTAASSAPPDGVTSALRTSTTSSRPTLPSIVATPEARSST